MSNWEKCPSEHQGNPRNRGNFLTKERLHRGTPNAFAIYSLFFGAFSLSFPRIFGVALSEKQGKSQKEKSKEIKKQGTGDHVLFKSQRQFPVQQVRTLSFSEMGHTVSNRFGTATKKYLNHAGTKI